MTLDEARLKLVAVTQRERAAWGELQRLEAGVEPVRDRWFNALAECRQLENFIALSETTTTTQTTPHEPVRTTE